MQSRESTNLLRVGYHAVSAELLKHRFDFSSIEAMPLEDPNQTEGKPRVTGSLLLLTDHPAVVHSALGFRNGEARRLDKSPFGGCMFPGGWV